MKATCPNCGGVFKVRDEHRGKRAKCLKCGVFFEIKGATETSSDDDSPTLVKDIGQAPQSSDSLLTWRIEAPEGDSKYAKFICPRCQEEKTFPQADIAYVGKTLCCSKCSGVFRIHGMPEKLNVCADLGVQREITSQNDRTKSQGMIHYKCWNCGERMTSYSIRPGQENACSHCEMPNQVPEIWADEKKSNSEICYFCSEKPAVPGSARWIPVSFGMAEPSFQCPQCGLNWVITRKSTTSGGSRLYFPKCPECGNVSVFPIGLPQMPTGTPFSDFKISGVYEDGSSGWRTLVLRGFVHVPRCSTCKLIHGKFDKVLTVLMITIGIALGLVILKVTGGVPDKMRDVIAFIVIITLIFYAISIPVGKITRKYFLPGIVRRLTKRKWEWDISEHDAVKWIKARGWTLSVDVLR